MAKEARRPHRTLHLPSKQTFDWMIRGNQIKNCKATPDHAEIAHNIWGESKDYLKGSRVRSKTKHVDGFKLKVPTEYLKLGREVYLTCYVFFVNKIPFFITLSRKIYFTATNHLKRPGYQDNFSDIPGGMQVFLSGEDLRSRWFMRTMSLNP